MADLWSWTWKAALKQLSAKTKSTAKRNPVSFIWAGNWPVRERENQGTDTLYCRNMSSSSASWVPS